MKRRRISGIRNYERTFYFTLVESGPRAGLGRLMEWQLALLCFSALVEQSHVMGQANLADRRSFILRFDASAFTCLLSMPLSLLTPSLDPSLYVRICPVWCLKYLHLLSMSLEHTYSTDCLDRLENPELPRSSIRSCLELYHGIASASPA